MGALLALGPTNFRMQLPSQNIYLDNSGTGGDGSIENPYGPFSEINWATIADWVAAGGTVNINLKRGVTWSEQLTIGAIGAPGSSITIKAYGTTGDEPIINGSSIVIVNPSAQSDETNFTSENIYLDNGGPGAGTEADPYGSFSEIKWTTIAEWVEAGIAVNINLKCGVEWSEQLEIGAIGAPGSPITIKAYGTGDDPIINGLSFVEVDFTEIAERFIDNGDGTVTDTFTDLVWLQNANCDQPRNWDDAALFVSGLDNGDCGLSDGSESGDWRLPTKDELQSIGTDPPITWSNKFPPATWTMPSAPFTIDPASDYYWSGDFYKIKSRHMWIISMSDAYTAITLQSSMRDVWPVRDAD